MQMFMHNILTNSCARIYYQLSPNRLAMCTLTIHALLHIADSIEASGPVWASWAFPTERHCGSLIPAIKSRRFPFPSLDRYVTELAQLTQAKIQYNLEDVLSLRAPKGNVVGLFSSPACEFHSLLCIQCVLFKQLIIIYIRSNLCSTSPMHSEAPLYYSF
jgi:hypothetical protein